jgi:hypothetical protein
MVTLQAGIHKRTYTRQLRFRPDGGEKEILLHSKQAKLELFAP